MPKLDLISKAKPSTFAYPAPLEEKKGREIEKVETAVLSTTARSKAKEKKKRASSTSTTASSSATTPAPLVPVASAASSTNVKMEDMEVVSVCDFTFSQKYKGRQINFISIKRTCLFYIIQSEGIY